MRGAITQIAGKFITMTPMSDNDIYDYIFIGSSPLSLLQALKSADEGARILVLNKQNQLGGCWSWMSQDGLAYERARMTLLA